MSEIITPPRTLPVTVAAADQALAAAVVEEIERGGAVAIDCSCAQTRRITLIDGPLPPRIELEPVVEPSRASQCGPLPMTPQ